MSPDEQARLIAKVVVEIVEPQLQQSRRIRDELRRIGDRLEDLQNIHADWLKFQRRESRGRGVR